MSIQQRIAQVYLEQHPGEAASLIERTPSLADTLTDVSSVTIRDILDKLDPSHLRNVFLKLTENQRSEVLRSSSVRLSLTLLRSLEEGEREETLQNLDQLAREELLQLLNFGESSAGYYLDQIETGYKTSDTVGEALTKLQASRHKRARSLYVVDPANRFAGRVDLQDMATTPSEQKLASILNPVDRFVFLTSSREELLEIFNETRVDSVAVLDQEMALVGVVRYDALFQAAEDQASANMQKMVGASAEERALSQPWFAVKKRLPWLHINLLTAFLAASVVGLFENIIAQFTALAILLPVVAGQSGNAGSQALAVTMRGLSLKEINVLHWRSVLSKEVQIGVIDGLALALTCGLGVLVWSSSPGLAVVIAIAMVVSMVAAGVSGALVPMMLVRFGQDPATASSIILTTVTDVVGFFAFLGTATLLAFML